jgi:hypothetical protein
MKIAIVIPATRAFTHALHVVLPRLLANIRHVRKGGWYADAEFKLFGVSDDRENPQWTKFLEGVERAGISTTLIKVPDLEHHIKYTQNAQLVIAALQGAGLEAARRWDADYCWSLESDVIPPHNALRCLLDSLNLDDYYSISMVTYNNGLMLGGRGTPANHIAEDFYPEERILPPLLKAEWEAIKEKEKALSTPKEKASDLDTVEPAEPPIVVSDTKEELEKKDRDKEEAKQKEIHEFWEGKHKCLERIKQCPVDGDVYAANAKGWKPRGWFDNAFPAIGKGAFLETDWVGMGCTLMNKDALEIADFADYFGGGTQDLFLCWRRWKPAGMHLCVISHCLADHIIRSKDQQGNFQYTYVRSFHEQMGECVGHIRHERLPWNPKEGSM